MLRTLAAGVDRIGIVQISDFVLGTRSTPNRVPPGDGDIPIAELVRTIIDHGYAGMFDVEIIGPAIEDEGYRSAIGRTVETMTDLLESMGAGP